MIDRFVGDVGCVARADGPGPQAEPVDRRSEGVKRPLVDRERRPPRETATTAQGTVRRLLRR